MRSRFVESPMAKASRMAIGCWRLLFRIGGDPRLVAFWRPLTERFGVHGEEFVSQAVGAGLIQRRISEKLVPSRLPGP